MRQDELQQIQDIMHHILEQENKVSTIYTVQLPSNPLVLFLLIEAQLGRETVDGDG